MEIKYRDPVRVSGPTVSVEFSDSGKAEVAGVLAIGDGTKFMFDGANTTPSASTFPPGKYRCTLAIHAFNHGAFGTSYNTLVKINGSDFASTSGDLGTNTHDEDVAFFELEVSK